VQLKLIALIFSWHEASQKSAWLVDMEICRFGGLTDFKSRITIPGFPRRALATASKRLRRSA
jgi:hypothetical protein